VVVPVSVTDKRGRPIDDLQAEDFRLREEGVTQTISRCMKAFGPVRTIIVLDQSESMKRSMAAAYDGVAAFVGRKGPEDTISVITVRDDAGVEVQPTKDGEEAMRDLGMVSADGGTALFDGVYLGLTQLMKAKDSRKALLIISDGGDNSSSYTSKELLDLAIEAGALVFSVAVGVPFPVSDETFGQDVMRILAEQTGGHFYIAKKNAAVTESVKKVEPGLYYDLYFSPTQVPADGRMHKIDVQVTNKKNGRLFVHWRRQYRAAIR
jgi:VWFA-related protein